MKKQIFFILTCIFFSVPVLAETSLVCGQSSTVNFQPKVSELLSKSSEDHEVTIDYAVLYTPAAKAANGSGTHQAMLDLVTDAFESANQYFRASGLLITHNLVHVQQLSANNSSNNLEEFRSELAVLAEYSEVKENYAVDSIITIVEFQLPGAYANIPLSGSQAIRGGSLWFGLPNVSGPILAHEIGHTLGSKHDYPLTTSFEDSLTLSGLSYGNHFIGSTSGLCYRTLMSATLACRVSGFESENSQSINLFSGPNVVYDGAVTGDSERADNVRVFKFYAPFVGSTKGDSQFPPATPTPTPTASDPDDQNTNPVLTLKPRKKRKKIILKGKCTSHEGLALSGESVEIYQKKRLVEVLKTTTACNTRGRYKVLTKGGRKFKAVLPDYSVETVWKKLR